MLFCRKEVGDIHNRTKKNIKETGKQSLRIKIGWIFNISYETNNNYPVHWNVRFSRLHFCKWILDHAGNYPGLAAAYCDSKQGFADTFLTGRPSPLARPAGEHGSAPDHRHIHQ